jgi:DNA-binding SARP family transcriptional activator/tetratricopeptide (TPR) repeat protein
MELRLLGPVHALIRGTVVDLGPRQRRLVLAVLALEVNRLVPIDRLIELVWPVSPPRTAAHAVRVSVSSLRALLAEAAVDPGELTVVTRGSGYQLRADPMLIDVHRFQALVARAREAVDDPTRVALLDEAIGLWRGPALIDTADPEVIHQLVGGVSETRLVAEEDRFDALLRLGRHHEVLGGLTTLVDQHPSRERLVGQLMLALHRGGQSSRALAVSRVTRQVLCTELGLDPGEDLGRLELAILRNDPALTVRAADPALTLTVPALLPPAVHDFTGRVEHLDRLDACGPVKVIAGTAGVGKTALAVQWAHRVRARFPDGQLYANLNGYSVGPPVEPAQVLSQFLRAVGVQPEQVPVDLAEAAGRYRSLLADRKVLVLLDNAVSAEQVRPLLPAGAGCEVVITSRDRLDGLVALDGARRVALDVLSPKEAVGLLGRMLGQHRVDVDPEAASALAHTCAYLPLALRITAARLVNHPGRRLAEHVAALSHGDLLTSLRIDGDEQTAVRAAFDLSYAGLKPEARELFRRLGLVPGPDVGVTAAAALVDTTVQQAAELLDRLAAAHLVDQATPGRYTSHDLLRHYARQRAAEEDIPQERAAVISGLLDHYLRHARAAAGKLYPHMLQLVPPEPGDDVFEDHASALRWLDAEGPGMIAAIHHAGWHGERERAWLLADALRGYLYTRRELADWLAVAKVALAAAQDNARARAAVEFSLATANYSLNQYPRAVAHCTEALRLCRETGWLAGEAAVLNNLGLIKESTGQLADAAGHYEAAMTIGRRLGNKFSEELSLVNLGMIDQQRGQLGRSARFYRQALDVLRELGAPDSGIVLTYLGAVLCEQGQLGLALEQCTRGLAWSRETGARNDEAYALTNLAKIHRAAGRFDQALASASAALELAIAVTDQRTEACARTALASTYAVLGEQRDAVEQCQHAIRVARGIGARYEECEALTLLASCLHAADALVQATDYAQHALGIAWDVGYGVLAGRALGVLAQIHLAAGDPQRAVAVAEEALPVQRECGDRLGTASTLYVLGFALRAVDGTEAALPAWRESHELYTHCGSPEAARIRPLIGD